MMRQRSPLALGTSAALALACLALSLPAAAEAGPRVGLDAGVALPLDLKAHDLGPVANLQLGYELKLGPAALTPELYGGYIGLGAGDEGSAAKIYRATGGARFGFGAVFRPFLAAHVGYGLRSEGKVDDAALTADGQLGTDFTLLPILSLGASLGYTRLFVATEPGSSTVTGSDKDLQFLTGALQAALTF